MGLTSDSYMPKGQLIEVKYKSIRSPEINRSFRSFIKKYNPEKAIIVNLDYKDAVKIENTEVLFLPYYELESNRVF